MMKTQVMGKICPVAGAGACEIELARQISKWGKTIDDKIFLKNCIFIFWNFDKFLKLFVDHRSWAVRYPEIRRGPWNPQKVLKISGIMKKCYEISLFSEFSQINKLWDWVIFTSYETNLRIVPRTLAENSGMNDTEIIKGISKKMPRLQNFHTDVPDFQALQLARIDRAERGQDQFIGLIGVDIVVCSLEKSGNFENCIPKKNELLFWNFQRFFFQNQKALETITIRS